jgi:hypothetical protein
MSDRERSRGHTSSSNRIRMGGVSTSSSWPERTVQMKAHTAQQATTRASGRTT